MELLNTRKVKWEEAKKKNKRNIKNECQMNKVELNWLFLTYQMEHLGYI